MNLKALTIDSLATERLILVPYTLELCNNFLDNNFNDLFNLGFKKGVSWPDADVLDTLPRIVNNLSKVELPTGFESWMIIKKETLEIIGDLGFKGFNTVSNSIDIGYGIIIEERRKGYAEEASIKLIDWAFSTGIVKEITAQCQIDNFGSINILKKLRFCEINRVNQMIYWCLKANENLE